MASFGSAIEGENDPVRMAGFRNGPSRRKMPRYWMKLRGLDLYVPRAQSNEMIRLFAVMSVFKDLDA